MHTVIETAPYLRKADEAGMTVLERFQLAGMIADDPEAGSVIEGTGGVRKVRFARKGGGKSGGFRVLTFYSGENIPVFLLSVYGKGAKVSLTKGEKNQLAKLTAKLVETYKKKVVKLSDRRSA